VRSRYRINNETTAHFITSTIVEWLPVFTNASCCDRLVRSLEHCRQQKALRIHAWVILDNHFHAVVSGPQSARTLAELKKFTARVILDQLKLERRDWLISALLTSGRAITRYGRREFIRRRSRMTR